MKQSWLIGIIALWVILTLLSNVAEQSTLMGQVDPTTITAENPTGDTQMDTLTQLKSPTFLSSNDWIKNPLGTIKDVIGYILLLFRIILLFYPVIWQGAAIWIYLVFFLPVGIGFIWSIILVIRGTGSS
jgi:sterol desaturase/sphingolipid hydroxylase (fatty acid hydroxylase superfamily)